MVFRGLRPVTRSIAAWFASRARPAPGRLLLGWLLVAPVLAGLGLVGGLTYERGRRLEARAGSLERRATSLERVGDPTDPVSAAVRERARALGRTPTEVDPRVLDSLRAEAPALRAEAEVLRGDATLPKAAGGVLLLAATAVFGLAVALSVPDWMLGPSNAGGWVPWVARSAGVLGVQSLLLAGLILTTLLYQSLHGFSSLPGLLAATVLAPVLGALAGLVARMPSGGRKLPAIPLGLVAVVALFAAALIALADGWVRGDLYGVLTHGVWVASGALSIGLAFFAGLGPRRPAAESRTQRGADAHN